MNEVLIKIIGVLFGLLLGAAYFQNLWTSIEQDMLSMFLIGGVIPPVGMVFGIGVWVGIWP